MEPRLRGGEMGPPGKLFAGSCGCNERRRDGELGSWLKKALPRREPLADAPTILSRREFDSDALTLATKLGANDLQTFFNLDFR